MARQEVVLARGPGSDQGTVGTLLIAGNAWCLTLELPWRDNAAGASCIPPGTYRMLWTMSPRLRRRTYEVIGVEGRAGIRVHEGNLAGDVAKGYVTHSLGCPLVGARMGVLSPPEHMSQLAVLVSLATLRGLERLLGGAECALIVES